MSWNEDRLHRWLAAKPRPRILRGSPGHDAAVLDRPAGREVEAPAILLDVLPTLAGLCGIELTAPSVQGVDLSPALRGTRCPVLAVIGVCLNRWVMVLQVMAVPVMSFDTWAMYYPSWQEVATTVLPVAYGIILIMISYRYLPVFPNEAELNPLEPETPVMAAAGTEEAGKEGVEPELTPAEA